MDLPTTYKSNYFLWPYFSPLHQSISCRIVTSHHLCRWIDQQQLWIPQYKRCLWNPLKVLIKYFAQPRFLWKISNPNHPITQIFPPVVILTIRVLGRGKPISSWFLRRNLGAYINTVIFFVSASGRRGGGGTTGLLYSSELPTLTLFDLFDLT